MNTEKNIQAGREIKRVTYLSVVANVALFIIKLIVGLFSGSTSLVADGIHSLSDMTTDGAVLLGQHLGSKEPDPEHPYGHGRIETLSALIIALVLVIVGCGMVYYSVIDIARQNVSSPSVAVLIVALISVFGKELLYRITKAAAVKSHSTALYANAWHHRSDALSSIAVVGGVIALQFGFKYGDQTAASAVGLMVVVVGVQILGECLREFTETSIDQESIESVKSIINSDPDIRHWHKLRSRAVGREMFLDVHILVDPGLDITAAHDVSSRLERSLEKGIKRPINITVHVEPDLPELRE